MPCNLSDLTALFRRLPATAYFNCQYHAAVTDTSARYVYVDCGCAVNFAMYGVTVTVNSRFMKGWARASPTLVCSIAFFSYIITSLQVMTWQRSLANLNTKQCVQSWQCNPPLGGSSRQSYEKGIKGWLIWRPNNRWRSPIKGSWFSKGTPQKTGRIWRAYTNSFTADVR